MTPVRGRQTLILDGDDTLWENNVHFERAIAAFIEWLGHADLSHGEVRAVIDEIERANVVTHGYGSVGFAQSLRDSFSRLRGRGLDVVEAEQVALFAARTEAQPIELIAGVAETLPRLAERHDLWMLTKGNQAEQQVKVDGSGLGPLFRQCLIVPEKDDATYHWVLETYGFDPATTWMIGNSPKSDINPALRSGLNAVLIPHEMTWALEHDERHGDGRPGRFEVVRRFADLAGLFLAG